MSGARALRKYACGASTKWDTVHAGQEEQRAASVSNRVLATRAKRKIIGVKAGTPVVERATGGS
eukprot:1820143-Pleurochrysis_carterae.AAC.4